MKFAPGLVTVNDAVAALNISRSTVYERIKDGSLQSVRQGGRVRILPESFQALLLAIRKENASRNTAPATSRSGAGVIDCAPHDYFSGVNSLTNAPLLMSITEAAKTLSVSRGTIYNLLEAGVLKRVKIGEAARITTESVHAIAANGAEISQRLSIK